MIKSISILGSTGSIGENTLKVVDHISSEFNVKYLTAGGNAEKLVDQALMYQPQSVAILDIEKYDEVSHHLRKSEIEVLKGREGILDIASRNDIDLMVNALVGSSGMEPTVLALSEGVNVALSNKESMVMAGGIISEIRQKTGAEIYPVDSEHSAIWQCLTGENNSEIKKIILTGSGGPFREKPLNEFAYITVEQALNHPNWKMGKKITIDSATMMNKGLEVIEAFWLFQVDINQIEIVVHPQSIIHSMVEFVDGSVKAQLGLPDMKVPIQYALTNPERKLADWESIDFTTTGKLTFEKPDLEKFPCIRIAFDALEKGGSAPAALNVTNDNTVKQFLDGNLTFSQIAEINEAAIYEHEWSENPDLDFLKNLEIWGENFVNETVKEGKLV
tara:strand:- start:29740 stop:30906 length:1167 start_codon:yes stop_codon:yes gene_type:complete